jgi:hypothetical protein
MVSGSPRPATTGSAKAAPASANLRINGSGLISLFIGMKPDTIVCGPTASGKARAAIASAAAWRRSAGSASRRTVASPRSVALAFSVSVNEVADGTMTRTRSAEPRRP